MTDSGKPPRQRVPTLAEAERLLEEGLAINPGLWGDHSRNVGRAGQIIADLHPDLDGETALVMGLLHDIGRRDGSRYMRHIVDGFRYMNELGYPDAARICLSHSFPLRDLDTCVSVFDCSDEEMAVINDFVDNAPFDDYDLLFQLCDSLALPEGFCILEKRMVDVVIRHGGHARLPERWKRVFEIKAYFDEKIGRSIYEVLPGIVENTLR